MDNKIWFKRKLYGWGWTPCTWEGWLVIIIWTVIFLSLSLKMNDHEWLKNVIFMIISVGILFSICYKKGEKPKWQWGKRIED